MKLPPLALVAPSLCPRCDQPAMVLDRLKDQYADEKPAAEKLLSVGESKRDKKLDPVEHAAYTALCLEILKTLPGGFDDHSPYFTRMSDKQLLQFFQRYYFGCALFLFFTRFLFLTLLFLLTEHDA